MGHVRGTQNENSTMSVCSVSVRTSCIVTAYIVMAYIVVAPKGMAYEVMALGDEAGHEAVVGT